MMLIGLLALRFAGSGHTRLWVAAIGGLCVSIVGVALATEVAYPLYAYLPSFRAIQRPLRFLTIPTISAAVALGVALAICKSHSKKLLNIGLVTCAGMSVAVLAALQYDVFAAGRVPSSRVENVRHETSLPISAGRFWQEYLETGGLDGECRRKSVHCEAISIRSDFQVWRIASPDPTRIVLPLFAFPGWSIESSRKGAVIEIDENTGLYAVSLEGGIETVSAKWSGRRVERLSNLLSGLGLLICAVIFAHRIRIAIAKRRS